MIELIKNIIRLYEKIPLDIVAIMARFAVGLVFFKSGLTKIEWYTKPDAGFFERLAIKPSTFFLFDAEYSVPLLPAVPAAYIGTISELVLPILLWIGLGTRISATMLLAMTAVIQIFNYPGAYSLHALWAVALLYLMAKGPGALSIDHYLRKKYMG